MPTPGAGEPVTAIRPRPSFAHASEAELARILDFYDVAWAYEPHTFPILFDRDGAVLESFSPDFYLPDLDLYIELTTLKQRLVRRKNRKLRRLRELYPDIRIKLLYARDFRALLLKYGRIALADAFSGTEGQATPPRPHPASLGSGSAEPGAAREPASRTARGRRRRRARADARNRAVLSAAATLDATATLVAPGTETSA